MKVGFTWAWSSRRSGDDVGAKVVGHDYLLTINPEVVGEAPGDPPVDRWAGIGSERAHGSMGGMDVVGGMGQIGGGDLRVNLEEGTLKRSGEDLLGELAVVDRAAGLGGLG